MGVLNDYENFHKINNLCTDCHGKGYKRVCEPYKRYDKWNYDFYRRYKCKKCNGTGKYQNS